MNNILRKLKQNKGMSLVEVVVSVAVSFIVFLGAVSFIATSTSFFKKQESTIDLQNELMETSNKIHDTLMEASAFEISPPTSDGGIFILTGKRTATDKAFATGKGSARRIEWNKAAGELYVLDTPEASKVLSADERAGYLIGSHVTNVQITILDECKIPQPDKSVKYEQPLMLSVHVEVSDGKETRHDTKTVTLRNEFDEIVLYGVTYINEGNGILVKK